MFHPLNYRDVGECVAILIDEAFPLRPGMLFRGGKFDEMTRPGDVGHPKSIINLRRGPDPGHLDGVSVFHVPADNTVENYRTELKEVRRWVGDVLNVIADPDTRWPIYLHCTSGKDRTGVVVAAILTILGIPDDIVVEEFMLSDNVEEKNIRHALEGLRPIAHELLAPKVLAASLKRGAG